jgi:hypothetical protein
VQELITLVSGSWLVGAQNLPDETYVTFIQINDSAAAALKRACRVRSSAAFLAALPGYNRPFDIITLRSTP